MRSERDSCRRPYCFFKEKPHKLFKRKGDDILLVQPVTFSQAALGVNIMVNGIEGEEELSIPQGTQFGSILKLKGKGLNRLEQRGRGDLLVQIAVITPTNLTSEQKELLKKLSETEQSPAEVRESHGFRSVLKEVFGI
jgi:molecular chaperone DnaJ